MTKLKGIRRRIKRSIKNKRLEIERAIERSRLLEELEEWCAEKGYDLHPYLMDKPPIFSNAVEGYISTKARENLPPEQFLPEEYERDICDLIELGGILGYDGDQKLLKEHAYHNPDCNARIIDNPIALNSDIADSGEILSDIGVEDIISWNTQPSGCGSLTTGDLDNLIGLGRLIKGIELEFYHVIYLPRIQSQDKFLWYGFLAK